jgi:hypothetical protein
MENHHERTILIELLLAYEFEFQMMYIDDAYCVEAIFGNREYIIKSEDDAKELINDIYEHYIPTYRFAN